MAAWHGILHVPAALQRQTLIPTSACVRTPNPCHGASNCASAVLRACISAASCIACCKFHSPHVAGNAVNAARFWRGRITRPRLECRGDKLGWRFGRPLGDADWLLTAESQRQGDASCITSVDTCHDASGCVELTDESDFRQAASEDGRISIIGFGSLLSERSARSTFPSLEGFRQARLRGFRRVFCHAAPVFFIRGIANSKTKEYSSLSVEPCEGEEIVVTLFSIPVTEVPAFIEREHEFRFLLVICSRYSDQEYLQIRLKGDRDEYEKQYGRWGVERVWDDTLLPCRVYLRHCVLAAQGLGEEALASFLDHTFLADRQTTIRQYLLRHPDIMSEPPPPSLADRYGG